MVTYSSCISAMEKGGQWEKALSLLDEMSAEGIPPETITINAAISACEKASKWQAVASAAQMIPSPCR